MVSKPILKVIKGDKVDIPEWLDLPQLVTAKGPTDPNVNVQFRVSRSDIFKQALHKRRQPVFDFWSMIDGKPPPVNNVERNKPVSGELTRLVDAQACFKGLERPIAEDDSGDGMLAYCLKPSVFYMYEPSMVCVAKRIEVPVGLVFMVYVRLDEPCEDTPMAINGSLTHWQFVPADENEQRLPHGYSERYNDRLW